jgi:predicted glutamine amidotransferase
MNCAAPTDFSFSLKGFCRRGGGTDIHSHGFGLCVYEGHGLRSFHDTLPASESPIAKLLQELPIRTYVSQLT